MTDYILELRSLLLAVTRKNGKVNDLANHLANHLNAAGKAPECLLQTRLGAEAVVVLLHKGMLLEASNMASVVLSRLGYHY